MGQSAADRSFDVCVVGLGAAGSATAYHLAARGLRVLGLDRWRPGHPFGSSHGDSRIIREIYFEHPLYVPIVRRAYELWRDLEARTGRTLLREIGGLMIGPPDGEVVKGTIESARAWRMPYEVFSASELARQYRAFRVSDGDVAVLDRRAGFLAPEDCNDAHLTLAAAAGATLHFDEPVVSWRADGEGVQVTTPRDTYRAARLVLCAGARTQALLPGLRLPLEVERQTQFWFDLPASDPRFAEAGFPIWAYEFTRGQICYGFPRLARGLKAAVMHGGEILTSADEVRRATDSAEVEPLRRALARVLPDVSSAPVLDSTTCLFTNMPDGHFLIDVHPEYPQVLISSPCSGHGFKFASAIGEIHADLVTTGRSQFDLGVFRLRSPGGVPEAARGRRRP
jgi:sarcosine oxidase